MKTMKMFLILSALAAFISFSHALMADLFDDAERSATQFMDGCKKVKELEKSELVRLVQAICDADDDERKDVSREASSRVKDTVNREYDSLKRQFEDSGKLLDKVLADQNFKDKHSKANDCKSKIADVWTSTDKLTASVRGANHPVVAYMLEAGDKAHEKYQHDSSNCRVYEWELPGGYRIDCLKADPGELIEIKPDNSRAIGKGRDQLDKYSRILNEDPKEQERLVKEHPEFKSCFENGKKLTLRLALYKFCPELDDDGNYKSTSYSWRMESR